MASFMDSSVHGIGAPVNGTPARNECTHGCDKGMCGDTTSSNFLSLGVGIQCLTDEYFRLTTKKPSPAIEDAISHVVSAHVHEYAPTHVQHVGNFDKRHLMRKVIQTWFHIKQEGNFLLGGRYDVSWKDGNLRLEKISYKLRHEFTLCNDKALSLIMDILYDDLPVLVPQLHELLN